MKKRISKIWVPVGVIAIVAVVIFLFSQRKPKEEISFETVKLKRAISRTALRLQVQ